MFLHARKGHVEPLGKGCDRSVCTPELLQNAAAGGVRERAERGIEVGLAILSHMVQYTTWAMECNRRLSAWRLLDAASNRRPLGGIHFTNPALHSYCHGIIPSGGNPP